jgi:omega-amidase
MQVALVSLDVEWEDKRSNLERCRVLAARAAALGAELVVFPEMTLTGFSMNATSISEPPTSSPTIEAFSALSAELRVAIVFGVVVHGTERPRNTLVVVEDGREVARYAKIHPFTYAHEHEHYEGGDALVVTQVAGAAVGLSVCYDLRFPELFAQLAPAAEIVLVIANWPARRIAHWHALLVARAIECQCWVVGVNRIGRDRTGAEYPRSSVVITPEGERQEARLGEDEVDVYDLDPGRVADYRRRFPVLQDRRPAVYARGG